MTVEIWFAMKCRMYGIWGQNGLRSDLRASNLASFFFFLGGGGGDMPPDSPRYYMWHVDFGHTTLKRLATALLNYVGCNLHNFTGWQILLEGIEMYS